MSMAGDEELRNAFREQLAKVSEAKQRIAKGEEIKQLALKNEKSSRLAAKQLEGIGEWPVYRGVGRLFILTQQKSEIERHLKEAGISAEKAATIDKQKEFLQRSCEEGERNLRELVESRR